MSEDSINKIKIFLDSSYEIFITNSCLNLIYDILEVNEIKYLPYTTIYKDSLEVDLEIKEKLKGEDVLSVFIENSFNIKNLILELGLTCIDLKKPKEILLILS